MSNQARDEELALLFTAARTHYAWLSTPVDADVLQRVYELARWAPTGSNGQSLRVVFATSREAKERLRPALFPTNVDKAMTAPATAIAVAVLSVAVSGACGRIRFVARERECGG
jgi:3-hydroxypropanoate dehydrogenase